MSHEMHPAFNKSPANIRGIEIETDEASGNERLGLSGFLVHTPATSHGTYLDGTNEDPPPLEDYQPGGFHPVHLGDILGPSRRYRVIHKLGHCTCVDSVQYGFVRICRTRDASLSKSWWERLSIMSSKIWP